MMVAMRALRMLIALLMLAGLPACGDGSHWSYYGETRNDGLGGTGGASVDIDIYGKTSAEGLYDDTW